MTDDAPQPTSRIALVDGDTTTPLSAEALVVALLATVPDAQKGQVLAAALAVQAQLDQGQRIGLQVNRVLRPSNGVGP
jgi:hypothetical protein